MGRAEVGFFSFTEVPSGAHAAYNAWHQLDHLPSQFVIDGMLHGERWVLTPGARAAAPVLDDVLGRAQYLTLYLLGEPVESALAELRSLAGALRDVGRFFEDRQSHLFGGWAVGERAAAGRVVVDADVVPWRPATGVVAVVEPQEAKARPVGDLVAIDGVAGAWIFERRADVHHPSWATGPYRVTMLWTDDDPVAVAGTVPRGSAVHLAGYTRIVPGEWGWFD